VIEDGVGGKVVAVEELSRNACPRRFPGVLKCRRRWRGTLPLVALNGDGPVLDQRSDQRAQPAEGPPRLLWDTLQAANAIKDRLCKFICSLA